jgi:predicted nucleotidyltransferase
LPETKEVFCESSIFLFYILLTFIMTFDKKNKRQIIADYLDKRSEILFTYIFGSFTYKEKYHDVDIAVYVEEALKKMN